MTSSFEDILYRADRLSSSTHSLLNGQPQEQNQNALDSVNSLSERFDSSLDYVFKKSEQLWRRKGRLNENDIQIQANILLGEKGFSLESRTTQLKVGASEIIAEEDTSVSPSGYTEILTETTDLNSDKVKLDAERAFLNQYTVDDCQDTILSYAYSTRGSLPSQTGANLRKPALSSSSRAMEAAFAETLSNYIETKNYNDLLNGFMDAAQLCDIREHCAKSIWEQGVAVLKTTYSQSDRSSVDYINCLVQSSLSYLHKNFLTYIREILQRSASPDVASCDTMELVGAFLKVKNQRIVRRQYQDGIYGPNGQPVWELLYYCFRAGDYGSVAEIAKTHLQKSVALVAALSSIVKSNQLSIEDRDKVSSEWRLEAESTVDIYKKGIYLALLGCAGNVVVAELCDSIESWLWFKILPYRFDTESISLGSFAKLQRTIALEYGVEYFALNGADQALFFEALWLSGQFERAIDALYRSGRLVHAVHLGILAYVNNLLVTSASEAGKLLIRGEKESIDCSLNLARIVLMYVKSFECTNAERALDYYFMLRRFETPTGSNMFSACVSRAVFLSGESEEILGKIDTGNAVRGQGFIDKYSNEININDIIKKVASDSELSNESERAVQLYSVVECYDDAVRAMCSFVITTPFDEYINTNQKSRQLAIWLIDLCKRRISENVSFPKSFSILCLLVDLSAFFMCFHQKRYSLCMEIIKKLKCIPLKSAEVNGFVSMFHVIPVQIRSLLGELCVKVMYVVVNGSASKEEMRSTANAIIEYTARIPLELSTEVNARILELNSMIQ